MNNGFAVKENKKILAGRSCIFVVVIQTSFNSLYGGECKRQLSLCAKEEFQINQPTTDPTNYFPFLLLCQRSNATDQPTDRSTLIVRTRQWSILVNIYLFIFFFFFSVYFLSPLYGIFLAIHLHAYFPTLFSFKVSFYYYFFFLLYCQKRRWKKATKLFCIFADFSVGKYLCVRFHTFPCMVLITRYNP